VTEEGNPRNHRNVDRVEVFHPAPILRRGVVLVDTPGVGSTLRHNTEAALRLLPRCDAVLFVIAADPPVTEVELRFLTEIRARISDVFFALNKIDALDPEDLLRAVSFSREALLPAGVEDPRIFTTSARQGLEARAADDAEAWRRSGLQELESHLTDFLANERERSLAQALSRQAHDRLGEVAMQLWLTARSFQLPLDDLEARLAVLHEKRREAEEQRLVLRDLAAGERGRLLEVVEQEAQALRIGAIETLGTTLREALRGAEAGPLAEREASNALAGAIPGHFAAEAGRLLRKLEQEIQKRFEHHEACLEDLVEVVRTAAAEVFEIPQERRSVCRAFQFSRMPSWTIHDWSASFSPLPTGWAERLLPASVRRRRQARRLEQKIESLVLRNVESVRWAALQSVEDAFRSFLAGLDLRFDETIAATCGALDAVAKKRKEHVDDAREDQSRLEAARAEIDAIRRQLA
jgi:hypothetical protein